LIEDLVEKANDGMISLYDSIDVESDVELPNICE